MKKAFYIFIGLMMLILILELFYVLGFFPEGLNFLSGQKNTEMFKQPIMTSPNKGLPSGFAVQSGKEDDLSGRSVVFTSHNEFKHHSGSGVVYIKDSSLKDTDTISYSLGEFQGWEEIPDSLDKYILMTDPASQKELPKFRVLFTPSSLLKNKEKVTLVRVVDLNLVNRPYRESIFEFLPINQLTEEQLEKILINGDIVMIQPYFYYDSIFKDENGYVLGGYLTLRRFGGKQVLNNELSLP